MAFTLKRRILSAVALGAALFALPAHAGSDGLETAFDNALGTDLRAPRSYTPKYTTDLERRVALAADGANGRIGVAAVDLSTGEAISILGDQRFPMASTSKIAIAATFMEGVEKGRWRLDDKVPLMVPKPSKPFSTKVAPVTAGTMLPASQILELMITRSSNTAADALLAVVGGPEAVNRWVHKAGIDDFRLDRDIATLVRDDGEIDPAVQIDLRDSATPKAMVQLLSGIYQGRWLKPESRAVIIGAMERCRTGTRRIPALLPAAITVAHKTGSLNNTSSDIGIIQMPNGHAVAVAIYVTGQGSRPARETRISQIARTIYDGYGTNSPTPGTNWVNARY
jgi:beta-lactamase class A